MARPHGTKYIETPEEQNDFFDLSGLRENFLNGTYLEDDYCARLDEILKKEMSDPGIKNLIDPPTQTNTNVRESREAKKHE